jgi:hypothetical protein
MFVWKMIIFKKQQKEPKKLPGKITTTANTLA